MADSRAFGKGVANLFEVLGDCDDEGNSKLEVVNSDNKGKDKAPVTDTVSHTVICEDFVTGFCQRDRLCPFRHPVTFRSLIRERARKERETKWCWRDVFEETCFGIGCPYRHAETKLQAALAAETISEEIYRRQGSCKFAMLHFAGKGKKCRKAPWDCRAHPQTLEQYERWRADLVEQKKSVQCRLELTEAGCPHGDKCNYMHSS